MNIEKSTKSKSYFYKFILIFLFISGLFSVFNNEMKLISINPNELENFPRMSSQSTEINIIWNKTYGGDYIDTAQSITRSSL